MENLSGEQIIPNSIEQLENLFSKKNSGEYEKAGPFHHVAALAIKTFKVPLALVVFTGKRHVLKPNQDMGFT